MLIQGLIFGGILYAGRKWLWSGKTPARSPKKVQPSLFTGSSARPGTDTELVPRNPEQTKAGRDLLLATTSLGMAGGGILLKSAWLGLASLPITLYVFYPVFRNAHHAVLKEQKVNDQVLYAGCMTVCTVMNYTFTGATAATFYALVQKQQVTRRIRFSQDLPEDLSDEVRHQLQSAAFGRSHWQTTGESRSEKIAPVMLASFVIALPLIGPNHAAAFLTTTFGAHLTRLGPYSSSHNVAYAANQGVLFLKTDALDQINTVDTVLVSEAASIVPGFHEQVKALFSQPAHTEISIFSPLAKEQEEALIQQKLHDKQRVCLISCTEPDETGTALITLTFLSQADSASAPRQPDIALTHAGVQNLALIRELANIHRQQQQFNLTAPVISDVIDISTTLFLDFGLLYSVLFTNAGLFIGMANTEHSVLSKVPENKNDIKALPEESQVLQPG